jgi:hypothetical protein
MSLEAGEGRPPTGTWAVVVMGISGWESWV